MTASQERKEKRQRENRQVVRTFALVLQLGITMLTCIFLCLFLWRFLADRLGIPALFPILLVLGILAVVSFFKVLFYCCISIRICSRLL